LPTDSRTTYRAFGSLLKNLWIHAPLLLSGVAGGALAFWRFGPVVFSPENISWFRGDSTWHFLNWNFFRNEPWHFPPGRIEHLLAPLGTSIGGGDALPLLAFPLKLLNAFLPTDFQYLGFWLFTNYTLQGVFGYLLVRTFCRRRWPSLLAGLLFLFSPVMIFRAGHIALSSHWLLLLALWHYFRASNQLERRSYTLLWLLIVGLVGLTHPYLVAMAFPIAFLSVVRESLRGKLGAGYAAGLTFGLLALLGLEWWVSGIFGLGRGGGFEFYTLNPNALINPLDHSRFLPELPIRAGQYEGFAYLGLGVLTLSVLPLRLLIRHPLQSPRQFRRALLRRGQLPLLLLCVGFSLFSLGNTYVFILEVAAFFLLLVCYFVRNPPQFLTAALVRAGLPERVGLPLLSLGLGLVMFAAIPLVTGAFRAPGRFVWPVYYLFYLSLIVFLFRRFSTRVATVLLLVGLTVQIFDLDINRPFQPRPTLFTRSLKSERWADVIKPFTTLAVVPPFELSVGGKDDAVDFAFLASEYGKKVSTGTLVRLPGNLEHVTRRLTEQALSGPRDAGTLYVFSAATFTGVYEPRLKPGLRCSEIDAYIVCHE